MITLVIRAGVSSKLINVNSITPMEVKITEIIKIIRMIKDDDVDEDYDGKTRDKREAKVHVSLSSVSGCDTITSVSYYLHTFISMGI